MRSLGLVGLRGGTAGVQVRVLDGRMMIWWGL